ncbi:mandelate racemase/muconate lactonizing enzyme family protein [Pseudalkalibacillus sp. A8]|uniref:mandelate racemase/muconate lactonizing enzyme family protein n=1 Tax=Pseudalkalibacillus sp. A8 TaxID=3382641 RepID=UPI0038B66411
MTFRIGRRGIVLSAISAVDIALWDLLGKKTNMPVYKLLGAFSSIIRAYASGGYYAEGKGMEDLAKEAEEYVKMGFQAMKMKIGGTSIEEDVERIRTVKNVLGNKVKLAIDANNSYNVNDEIRLCKQVEGFDLFFFEEPLSTDFVDNSRYLAERTTIPIAGYETEYTRYGIHGLLKDRAVSIAQTDAIWSGGITECRKIGILASIYGLDIIPHFSAGAVSLAANLQL